MGSTERKLECPKCMGELREKAIGDKEGTTLLVDQCFACQGIWFDKGEFRQTLKLKLQFDSKKGEKEFEGEWRDIVFDLKTARCPVCKKEMERVKSTRGGVIVIDHCTNCDGTWLDGGEIRFLMKGHPIQKAVLFILDEIKDTFEKRPLSKNFLKKSRI